MYTRRYNGRKGGNWYNEKRKRVLPLNWLDILSKFGIPTLFFGAFVTSVVMLLKQIRAVKRGLQAVLCSTLVSKYTFYEGEGFVPIHERNDFENVYQQYHTLGANGVMDDLRNKFLALPVKPADEHPEADNNPPETKE